MHQPSDFEWKQIANKTAIKPNSFIYGVTTTRIYCLIECCSLLQKRENTVIFTSQMEAKNAEFRACKGCQPDEFG